jgi:hypothetical protein
MNTKRRFWRILFIVVVMLAFASVATPSPTTTQAALPKPVPPVTQPAICQMANPDTDLITTLNSVSAVPAAPKSEGYVVWAVGYSQKSPGDKEPKNTLTMRYEGANWKIVPSPNLPGDNYLTAVSARTPGDVWAAGYATINGMDLPMIMRFDGVAWNWALPSETGLLAPFGYAQLTSITVLPSKEVVAIGHRPEQATNTQTLVLYYDGLTWSEIRFSPLDPTSRFTSIAGNSVKDLWATVAIGSDEKNNSMGLLYHFDGKSWTLVSKTQGNLVSVAVTGSTVFAVGDISVNKNKETLAVTYDIAKGMTTRVKTINKDIDHNFLTAVVTDNMGVYAVGYTGKPGNQTELETLVMRFDGWNFNEIASPNPTGIDRLVAATTVNGNLWAVGDSQIWGEGFLTKVPLIVTTMCKY